MSNPITAVPIPTARYYPRLSEIVTVDDLPEFLSFVEDGLNSIFDKIHYKNLQYSKGYRGDSAFYSLDIVTSKKLALPLPFGLGLVLNPDLKDNDSSISSFPITLEYQWEILAFLKTFSSSSFSFSLEDFYKVGLQVFRISEEQVIAHMLNIFVEASEEKTKFEQLLDDISQLAQTDLAFPVDAEQSIDSVITLINNNTTITKSIPMLLFAVYIFQDDIADTKAKLQEFYNIIAPDGIEAHIRRIITPKAKATLALSAGIEFPQSVLRPVNQDGTDYKDPTTQAVQPNAKSMFVFGQAQLYADTEAGIGYQLELGGSLSPSKYAMIGKTGMILELDTLKVDLSKKTNIPEADADGRPNDFVGVYARAVSVSLPSKWFHSSDEPQGNSAATLKIGASDLLIGSGGLSGNIYLETVPVAVNGTFSYFDDKFDFVYPVTMFGKNEESDEVQEIEIEDYDALLDFLQQLNAAGLPYAFKYPLTLQTKNIVHATIKSNAAYTFNNAKDYQDFLSQLIQNTLWKTIGSEDKGFKVGFNKFDISFKQNKVIGSNIKGQLILEKFKIKEENKPDVPFSALIEGHLYDDGDFNLTASFNRANPPKANLFNFINFDFYSLELGKDDDDYYLGTSCNITFPNPLMEKIMDGQGIGVDKLRIYSDGSIEIEGGSIPIPGQVNLNLGPVKVAVTNINFGSTQINGRKFNFFGFDGAISVNPLGVDARGEGIKYYFPADGSFDGDFLRIQTIEVDLMIPGTATASSALAIIHGMISLPEPGKSKEFIGEVSLKLPKAKISGSVGMRFMPKYPAFLVDASIELPVPIPLGFLSISAFRGLIGYRYVATKQAVGLTTEDSWYDFYKHPKPGINIKKFSGPPESLEYGAPFSIGAGATFQTTADGGYSLSLRAMLLLSLPTLFMVDGGLNVISGRLGLIEDDPSNPPFYAMVAYGDDSLELVAGADFSIPKDGGDIFQLKAVLQSGFFFKNQKPWYINLGTKQTPIQAKIFKLFEVKAFVMISAQGIEAGARLDLNLDKKFGPAQVKLWAYLEMGGKISFKRPQMGGYMSAGGGIRIKIWIVKVEITLDTIFSIESFKPFLIYAQLKLSVRVKIGFVRVRKSFKIELQWDINRIIDRTPYSPLPKGTAGDALDNRTSDSVKGVHMLTNQGFALDYFKQAGEKGYDSTRLLPNKMPKGDAITQIIPLDTFIDIKMDKGLLPNPQLSKKIGGYTSGAKNYTILMPPDKTSKAGRTLRQVKHEFSIKSINLSTWNDATDTWVPYHPFEAVVKDAERTSELQNLPWAQWQKSIDQYDTIRVLATNPFSFLSAGEPGWHVPEQYGITPSKLFCASEKIKPEYTDFLNKDIGTLYYVPTQYEADKINGLFFKLIGEDLIIESEEGEEGEGDFMSITGEVNPHGFNRSLSFKNYNQLEILFPDSVMEPALTLTTQAKEVKISAVAAYLKNDTDKLVTYEKVKLKKTANGTASEELTYTKQELLSAITLFHENNEDPSKNKIDKIIITPVGANAERITEIRNEIAALFDETYNDEEGDFTISSPSDLEGYNALMNELKQLKEDAGNTNSTPVGNPAPLTYTNFYGYSGKTVYEFDNVFKYGDTSLISFHPQANTTVLLQLDARGNIIRERLLNGAVTSMQVVNGNLLLTQAMTTKICKGIGEAAIDVDFVVGCADPAATTAIIELDSELNQTFGKQYQNTYSASFNKLFPLANNELLWINTLEDKTQVNWIGESDRAVINRLEINTTAIKALQHNAAEFSLITKDKKIIRLSINPDTKAISLTSTKVISDASVNEITDAVIADNKILVSVKLNNEKFGLVQINDTALKIIKNDTIFDSAVYLSNKPLSDNSVIAYNQSYLLVFNASLELTRLIKRGTEEDNASIINIQNEPSTNEILMLSSKNNEKGVYLSLFNDLFDNCSLHAAAINQVTSSVSTLANGNVLSTGLSSVSNSAYTVVPKNSKLITVNSVICSNANDEDEELGYTTSVQRIDWLSKENYIYNINIPAIEAVEENNEAMKAAIQNTVQPIWRPNTTYCLNFTLVDKIDDKKEEEFEYYYGFKTLGPIGHYPVPPPATTPGQQPAPQNELTNLSNSPLSSLRQYLDYNRSYPNADGNLLQSKPAFYGNGDCKVSLFFTSPYVYHMFKDWQEYGNRPHIKGALNLIIKDPLNDVLIKYPLESTTTSHPVANQNEAWVDDNDPRIPAGIQLLKNLLPEKKCSLSLGNALKPKSYSYEVQLTDLKPSKLYTILVNNYFDPTQNNTDQDAQNILVHQFGFQTSRYKNFREQVQSFYVITDEPEPREAIFDVNLSVTQNQADALYHLVSASKESNALSDAIAGKYQHAFDRAIEGILKLSPLDPAQNTEINRIVDTATGDVVALLIRNPEPFNIPKIPLDEIKDTILLGNTHTETINNVETVVFTKNADYKILHSKDYSQALIMHTSKKITESSDLSIQFEYREWNNDGIVVNDLVPLTLSAQKQILPNINL